MRIGTVLLVSAALALAGCAGFENTTRDASVFRASNGFLVHPLPDGRFEVIPRGNSSSNGFFCAAGDYAQRRLGEPPNARVVLAAPIGPSVNNPGGRSAKFTVEPPGSGSNPGLLVNQRRPGASLRTGHARILCNRDLPGFFPD